MDQQLTSVPTHVLLIEDSEDDAELLTLELRRGGLNAIVHRVETEQEFIESLETGDWNIIISDYNLPGFNAPRALEVANQYRADLPFIILSGAVVAKDAVELLRAGAHDFLEKNDMSRLVPAVERELREVQVRQEHMAAEVMLKKLYRAVEQSPVSVMITDDTGHIEYVNPTYSTVTGYDKSDVLGKLPDVMVGEYVSIDQNSKIWEAVKSGLEWRGEFCNQRKDGELFWEYVTVAPIKDDSGSLTNLLISKEDITYRKEAEEKLYRQANFDDLTQLPNRSLILERLNQAMQQYERCAVISIDLDNFKKVNDSLGHFIGDLILIGAAKRLRESLGNHQTVARVSGDEFTILIPDMTSSSEVENLLGRIVEAFRTPFEFDGHELFINLSAGVAVYPDDGSEPSELFRNAEAAMNQAKEDGRDGFCFFTSHMNELAQHRLVIENGLRRALKQDELTLFFQPIYDSESQRIVGAEALIRWEHPEKGLIMPNEFVGIAEEAGLIYPMGRWIIEHSCEMVNQFGEHGFNDFYIAINVSPEQVWDNTLAQDIKSSMEKHNISPDKLRVEVTENVCMQDTDKSLETMKKIVDMGIELSVDDFGTGYSSLSYLKSYPFSVVKIDRAFVRDIPGDKDDVALVDAMIAMAHSLGLKVVAEGVEYQDQLEMLADKKCDLIQGYYFSPPLPFDAFIELHK